MARKDMFYPLGDCAMVVNLGQKINLKTHRKVKRLYHLIGDRPFAGLIELVPTYTTLTIYYNPTQLTRHFAGSAYEAVLHVVQDYVSELNTIKIDDDIGERNIVNIPVCYDEAFGPDLAYVASHNEIQVDEVIASHTNNEYVVYMTGFVPGFPYLGGMSQRIATPRKANPRLNVAAGSVGIAGTQTGIYPIQSPGGWQIIGKTPVTLFQPMLNPPCLLHFGDVVRFYPISRETFDTWEEKTT